MYNDTYTKKRIVIMYKRIIRLFNENGLIWRCMYKITTYKYNTLYSMKVDVV